MVKYVYEVIEVTDYGKNKLDLDVGKILIKSDFHGFYDDMAVFLSENHSFVRTGRMHYLFKLFADTKKQKKEAVKELTDIGVEHFNCSPTYAKLCAEACIYEEDIRIPCTN